MKTNKKINYKQMESKFDQWEKDIMADPVLVQSLKELADN